MSRNTSEEPQLQMYMQAEKEEEQEQKKLALLSLFSGCGGMDLGFEGAFSVLASAIHPRLRANYVERELEKGFVQLRKTAFETVFANDILEDAKKAWVEYFSKRGHSAYNYHVESVVNLVKVHKAGHPVFPEKVDLVTGGFPCQDFSVAGKRKGFDSQKNHLGEKIETAAASTETRGQLYMWMKEVIELTEPKMFIAENVKGLVNLSNVKEIIQKDFAQTGDDGYFVFEPQVLHAADYGVSQSRERVFFIGLKKSALQKGVLEALQAAHPEYSPYPQATHAYTKEEEGRVPFVSLRELFAQLPEPEQSDDLSQRYYSKAKYMGKHCQGQIEIKLDGISPTIRAEHHGNIEFRRLSSIHGGKIEEELALGLKERRLTPRECALIQSFPPDYEFVIPAKTGRKNSFHVSPSKAYKIIGNAVPPLLAYHLAKRIEELWPVYFGEELKTK